MPPSDQTEGSAVSDRNTIPPHVFYSKRAAHPEHPKTPPESNVPLVVGSTPIAKKIASDYAYASEVKHQIKLNEELAKEMEGHFLGPMPLDKFLDTYLPVETSIPAWPAATQMQLLKLPLVKNENAMYKPFASIEALSGCVPGMVFYDTHANPDLERGGLAPDVSLYHEDNLPQAGSRTDFSKMSVFVELKLRKNSDPFCDPEDLLQPKADNCRFERLEQEPMLNRGQIGSYAAALSASQFRVHLFSVSICGAYVRFIRWDRSGAIVTQSLNYVKDPGVLANFFWRYSHLDLGQQGYDSTCCPASTEDIQQLGPFANDLRRANPTHREFRKLKVPGRGQADQERDCIISYPTRYDIRSPFARATRAMPAYDLVAHQPVFLKDYWRADVEAVEKEGDIYAILEQANVPNIAPFGSGNDVKDHTTITQNLRNEVWACQTADMICLRQYRMTLKVIGRKLTDFSSSWEFVSAIADAMEAHDAAYFDARILHRDVSVGNIIISHEGKGLLIDWDLCINLKRKVLQTRQPMRTGTWQFMSASLLRKPSAKHDIEDDRESSFYVLLWTALRYSKHKTGSETPTSPQDDVAVFLRGFDEVYTELSGDLRGGVIKTSILLGDTLSNIVQFYERPKLDELLSVLQGAFKVRYQPPPNDKDLQVFKTLKEQGTDEGLLSLTTPYMYYDGLEKLKKRGWLVDTMRAFLDSDDWPEADKTEPQKILSQTTSKRKLMQDQLNLNERATKRLQLASAPAFK